MRSRERRGTYREATYLLDVASELNLRLSPPAIVNNGNTNRSVDAAREPTGRYPSFKLNGVHFAASLAYGTTKEPL